MTNQSPLENGYRLAEKAMLKDVEKDGEVLLLKDGRRLKVNNSDDATVASVWMPSTRVTLRKRKGRAAGVTCNQRRDGRDDFSDGDSTLTVC